METHTSKNDRPLNIADFDPIFRKRDFATIKRTVHNLASFKKNMGRAHYDKMREDAEKKLANFELFDDDQEEFRQEDPRR